MPCPKSGLTLKVKVSTPNPRRPLKRRIIQAKAEKPKSRSRKSGVRSQNNKHFIKGERICFVSSYATNYVSQQSRLMVCLSESPNIITSHTANVNHRILRAHSESVFARIFLYRLYLRDNLIQRRCHELVHPCRVIAFDEVRLVSVARGKLVNSS